MVRKEILEEQASYATKFNDRLDERIKLGLKTFK
jgi:hypothetical protein